jgi:hypothetical protein
LAIALTTIAFTLPAFAQPTAQGFAVERFTPSPAGAGWLVLDSLDLHGHFGGAMALSTGYASNELTVKTGGRSLEVVSDRAVADFAFAATYDRFRLSLALEAPVLASGQSGTLGGTAFTSPSMSPASTPDSFSDTRVGLEARLLGGPASAFRLGASGELFIPTGKREDYDSDGAWRAMFRVLAAGDAGFLTYAAHVGVHLRTLDEPSVVGSPRGSELLFGAAFGPRFALGKSRAYALVVGPEVYGATAFEAFFGANTTDLEGMVSARVEGTHETGMNVRLKVGAGGGLTRDFGSPEARVVVGVELFGRATPSRVDRE